ncbi:MAG: hypothetical protein NW208_19255 [Bryobacter sp.]|nr:hypothetical protein [Bryobacter sp.]
MRLIFLITLTMLMMAAEPGTRTLLDAHNCYPYEGKFADRMERALKAGMPLAIEKDLVWAGGENRISHEVEHAAAAPTLEQDFFLPLKAQMEAALRAGNKEQWPLVTLNLDFKTAEPAQIANLHALMQKYRAWLSVSKKGQGMGIEYGPLLVLLGSPQVNEDVFYDQRKEGEDILAFGAANQCAAATEYRRWCNFAFRSLLKVPEWQGFVKQAHAKGLWVRVYTINGAGEEESAQNGWGRGYMAGGREAAEKLWEEFTAAGVDYIATDEYERFAQWKAKRQQK